MGLGSGGLAGPGTRPGGPGMDPTGRWSARTARCGGPERDGELGASDEEDGGMTGTSAATRGGRPGRRPGARRALAPLLALALASPAAAQQGSAPRSRASAAATITASDLRRGIGVLASDSMRGRDTPSPELTEAARWVAGRFRAFGLRPGLGNSFLQYYPVTVIEAGRPESQRLVLIGPTGRDTLRSGQEFVGAPTGSHLGGEGPLRRFDPDSGGQVPAGSIMLVEARPATMQSVFASVRRALREGAAEGALIVVDAPESYFRGLRTFFGTRRVSIGEPDLTGEPVALVAAGALPDGLREPLASGQGLPYGWSADLETDGTVGADSAMNVIGWLPGSDPDLRGQYVLFTAHMDRPGVGRAVDGDSSHDGADDDASGTATLVELAEAFAAAPSPPRRSLVFMAVSGQAKGLLGSTWYTAHPVFPLERTVADIDIDMIGRNRPDTVVAIGKAASSLGSAVDGVARRHPELRLSVIDDPWPEQDFYSRSDHYKFARAGVPILFFFGGVHEDDHGPSDEAGGIEYDTTARIGRLIYYLGRRVADADGIPEWDPDAYDRVVRGSGSR